jgi:hypothetical protein
MHTYNLVPCAIDTNMYEYTCYLFPVQLEKNNEHLSNYDWNPIYAIYCVTGTENIMFCKLCLLNSEIASSSSDNIVHCVIIRKLLCFIFNIQWEPESQ